MAKGRKIERKPPPITGCGFLDGIMPSSLQRSKNAYRSNLIVTCYPTSARKAICNGLDTSGKAVRYGGMNDFIIGHVKEIPNKQMFRLFVSERNFEDYLKSQAGLRSTLNNRNRDNWFGADVHVFIAVADGRMEQYAHDGILPEDIASAFNEADMGFMYNPLRNAFECQKSNTIPTLKGYFYPFKLPEPIDE